VIFKRLDPIPLATLQTHLLISGQFFCRPQPSGESWKNIRKWFVPASHTPICLAFELVCDNLVPCAIFRDSPNSSKNFTGATSVSNRNTLCVVPFGQTFFALISVSRRNLFFSFVQFKTKRHRSPSKKGMGCGRCSGVLGGFFVKFFGKSASNTAIFYQRRASGGTFLCCTVRMNWDEKKRKINIS
jgi:hypothetical protein